MHPEPDVRRVKLGARTIGPGAPVFIVAEAGVNHNGDEELARRLVDAAGAAGVDAVKFQTFRSEKVISVSAPQADYQRVNTGRSETQLEMARRLEMGAEQTERISDHCRRAGVVFLSSPFDEDSADLLERLGVPAFKVGSGELTNHRFLSYLAGKGRPLLLSTGMATIEETAAALEVVERAGNPQLCLFHCVSSYPTPPSECNLRAMEAMRARFRLPVGWSDHTLGIHVSVAAVALGAHLIEKHFTLDRGLPGPDHAASLEPDELAALVRQIREVEQALGDGVKRRMPCEENTALVARRSVHLARTVEAGQTLVTDDLMVLRPGTGIPAEKIDSLPGRRLRRSMAAGEMLSEDDLERI